MFKINPNEFQRIKPLSWQEVFEIWRETEAGNSNWEAHYKERGFNSWEEWRQTYAAPLKYTEKEWHLYKILDPMKSVPKFHGGPLKGWKEKYYKGNKLPAFEELVQHPEIQQHGYVLQLMNGFPKETTITGLATKDGVVVIEGMHRCCAVALAVMQGKSIESEVYIALAKFAGRLPIVGESRNKEGK